MKWASLGRTGSSSAEATVGSLLVRPDRVSVNMKKKCMPAYATGFGPLPLTIPIAVGSKAYPISNKMIVACLVTPLLVISAAFAGPDH